MKYRRAIYLLIIAVSLSFSAKAQELADTLENFYIKKANDNTLEKTRLDFSVPDMPAFKALGKDPSNILRPSTAKDIALTIGNFQSNGGTIIPKNLSIEVAPGLFKPWYTLQGYRSNALVRFLTKARISIGSDLNQETKVNSFAAGARITLLDNSDYRKDTVFLKRVYKDQDKYTGVWKATRDSIISLRYTSMSEFIQRPQSEQDKINEEARKLTVNKIKFDLDEKVGKALKDYKKEKWNAAKMDFAYSVLAQSPDSLIENAKVVKHLFWYVFAFRPSKHNNWCQFIFGINNNVVNVDDKMYNEFSGNLRMYAGANKVKFFIEGQYQHKQKDIKDLETLYSQIGVELHVYQGCWLHFGTGVVNALDGTAKSQLQSNINLSLSFPENFKLF